MRYLIVSLLLIGFSACDSRSVAPASPQTVAASPPPKTRLEQFQIKTGSVVIKGFTEIGTAEGSFGSTLTVSAMEFTDASTGAKQFGVTFDIKGTGEYPQKGTSYVDLDEVDSLLKGIDYIGHADKSVTKLANFEATYRTKGDFAITTFSSSSTGTMFSVQSGRFSTANAYFNISELPKVRELVQKAQATLQSIK